MKKEIRSRRWIGLAAGATLALASATATSAVLPPPPDEHAALREMQIAQEHAVHAVHAPSADAAHTQLHAVVNCLAGPYAPEFNPSFHNPCSEVGAGALVDMNDTARMRYAQTALEQARSGLRTSDLASIKQAALNTINALRLASI